MLTLSDFSGFRPCLAPTVPRDSPRRLGVQHCLIAADIHLEDHSVAEGTAAGGSSIQIALIVHNRTVVGLVRPKASPQPTDRWYGEEINMHTNPIQSTPAAQNEAAVKAAPRQNAASQPESVPQDKVTLSPQGQAQSQQGSGSTLPNPDGQQGGGSTPPNPDGHTK
jgi:hypothetical protein